MLGVSELDGNPEGGHREHASSLYSGGGRGACRVKRGDDRSPLEAKRIHGESQRLGPQRELRDRGINGTDPIVLALDSAGTGCSVVVAAGRTVLGTESDAATHGQAE